MIMMKLIGSYFTSICLGTLLLWVAADQLDDPSTRIKLLFDDYMKWRMVVNPEYATRLGVHDYDDKITEYTEAAFVNQKNAAEDFLAEANDIPLDGLTKKEKIDLKVFRSYLKTFINGFQFRKHSIYNNLNPLREHPVNQWNGVFSGLLYNNVSDYRGRAFQRMAHFNTYVDQRIALLQESIDLGYTSHSTALNGVIEKIDEEEIVTDPKDSPVFKRFFNRTRPADISLSEWNSLQTDCELEITNTYLPAWTRYRNFLRDTYLPATRKDVGVWAVPDGDKYYEECLRWHLTIDMTADQIHQKGLEEVDRIAGLMKGIMVADNFDGTLKDYLEYLKTLSSNFYQTKDEMMKGYRDIVERVHPTLQKAFNNLYDVPCTVEENADPQGVIAGYSSPSESRPYGVFTVNIYEPEKKPKSDMVSLSLHEAEPGHHTQLAYVFEKLSADMELFRKSRYNNGYSAAPFTWPSFTSYTEGWGLYGETLGEMLGVYEGDLHSLFGRYAWEIFRAIRLVVDSGMHAKKWTKERALEYIANYTTFTEYTNENEVNRYISWPGQACAYKIGQLKIEELRDMAERELGNDFDIREYHDQVLQLGIVPLDVLEEFINEWVQDVKDARDNKLVVEKLFDDYFEWRQMDNPEYSTRIGLYKYEDKVTQWTEEAFKASLEMAIKFLNRVENVKKEGLDDQTMIHLDTLKENLKYFINGYTYRKISVYNSMTPLYPPTSSWSGLLSGMRYNTYTDYQKAFARLSQLETYVDQRIHLMTQSIENESTLHSRSLNQIPEKMAAEIVSKAEDSTYYKIFFDKHMPSSITGQEWDELKATASDIIMNSAVPAWQKFKDFLDNVYIPNLRPWEGVWSIKGGDAFYRQCLRHHTSTELTPEEIHEIGLQEVARISKEMEKIMSANNFQGTLQEYIAHLRSDPNNFYTRSEDMLAGYEEIIRETRSKVSKVLLHVPEADVEVRAASNPQASGGSYSQPPLDGSRNGIFTANVFNPETKPKFTMVSLTLHEAEPGHHTQLAYSIENDIPLFRRAMEGGSASNIPFTFPSYTGFVEGWALYSETLGLEMDAFDETKWPHSVFGMYVSEMFRAVRLVVDTGIHRYGWSKQEAIDYAMNYTTYSPLRVDNEIDRYISWPGQACAYKIGQIKIAQLRQQATEQLGAKFDLREYNDEVLKVGQAPLSLLDRRITDWIETVKTRSPATTTVQTAGSSTATPMFLLYLVAFFALLINR